MKRRRFIVGVAGLAVGGKAAADRIDIGPVSEPMTADDIEIEDASTDAGGDAYESSASVRNTGRHTARVTVRFVPADSGDPRTKTTTVKPGETGTVTVHWDYAYNPSIEPDRIEHEISDVENTEDLNPL